MFKTTRFKLTLWYLIISSIISLFFSGLIFRMMSLEIDRFARSPRFRNFPEIIIDQEIIIQSKRRVALSLLELNGVILLLSGISGYFLAGWALRPIKEMVEEQNRFISDSSHELRTPLTSLKSALEVNLRDKKLTLSGAKTLITESIDEVNKLTSLSDSLLTLAQYQKSNTYSKFENLSLVQIIEESIKKIKPLADKKSITIKNIITDFEFRGNSYGLIDLFTILLDNAIKYSPAKKSITLTSKKLDGHLKISVIDQGVGISQQDLPHIFDRFFRSDTARSRSETGGYGLGLAIAKKIVDSHRGTISVKSVVSKGTTFIVQLPLRINS